MSLFRFPYSWSALAGRATALEPVVAELDDRDRALEDYLAAREDDLANFVDADAAGIILKAASDVSNPLTAGGRGTVTFTTPFPTSCASVVGNTGDAAATPATTVSIVSKSATNFVYEVTPNPGAVAYRINWIAIGT